MTKRKREKADMADKADKTDKDKKSGLGSKASVVRTRIAQILWLLVVVAALFLAAGALCVAFDLNQKNALVDFVINGANVFDLGVFSRKDGIKQFAGGNADVKNALFNWGLGAIAWLVVGKIVERVIRP